VKKIAITGPESTGKSWLARELSALYQVPFVHEYARTYIDKLNRPYVKEDLVQIARGQLEGEKALESKDLPLLICDTELIVIKIWSLHKYGACDPFILDQISRADYDLYLLCDVDLPWEADKQREHPQLRDYFFRWYKRELDHYGFPYVIIKDQGDQRLAAAGKATDKLMQESK
jgi:NadR type nicotinamide-nucleotide adenylyltransferase